MNQTTRKLVSLSEIVELARSLPSKNRLTFDAPVQGHSMFPFLRPGDTVTLRTGLPQRLSTGAIIGFYDEKDRPSIHRVIKIKRSEGLIVLITTRGDGRKVLDPPITPDRVIGMAITRVRNGHTVRFYSLSGQLHGRFIVLYQSTYFHLRRLAKRLIRRLPACNA